MPDEEAVADPVWVLNKTLYGRQQASQRFNEFVANVLSEMGFEQCPMQPQLFKHYENDQEVEVHQDDFHTTAKGDVLISFADKVKDKLLFRRQSRLAQGKSMST